MAVLVGFHMFNVGQNTAEKLKVTNAADAAAYSAAVWQARSLNYEAYTNRAIVANEVAVGQAASVVSWTQYAPHAIENIKNTWWFQILCNLYGFCGVADEAQSIAEEVADGVAQAAKFDFPMRSTIIEALGKSQLAMHSATVYPPTIHGVMDAVIKANNPTYRRGITDVSATYALLTKQFAGDERKPMRDVIMGNYTGESSRDGFSMDRHWWGDVPFPPDGDLGVPCFTDPLPVIRKRGASDMVGMDEWESFDTLSLHYRTQRFRFGIPRGCRDNEVAYGYGSGQFDKEDDAGENPYEDRHGDSRGTNPRAHGNTAGGDTDSSRGRVRESNQAAGIPTFRDVDSGTNGNGNRSGKASFALVVSKAGREIRTANNLNLVAGRLRTSEQYAASNMSALAAAEVYFKRPGNIGGGGKSAETSTRDDGRLEYANLFNPYWQARLASPTLLQAAAAKNGSLGGGPIATGGGLDPYGGGRAQ
jgi:hypothetical protein